LCWPLGEDLDELVGIVAFGYVKASGSHWGFAGASGIK
jgi:hypothetical protein